MSEKLKTCVECDEEKPLAAFAKHPLRLHYSRCNKCFPSAQIKTINHALAVASSAKYPGIRYERVLGLVNGRSHWEKIQTRVQDTLLLKKLAA